ncbi:kelch repeat [Cordyceps militaris]|uniref:Kelch repeat n=1 Tax=Cordyceps militaris TaxID=73501 RepID=A0A2H4SGQ8_CORMI|nr:kelch repeat [Cordyceps militaris]
MSLAAPLPPSSRPSPSSPTSGRLPVPVRPKFNSHITSDRLREGAGLRLPPFALRASNIQKGRTSVFRELGLEDDLAFGDDTYLVARDDGTNKFADAEDDAISATAGHRSVSSPQQQTSRPWYAKLAVRPALTKRQSSQGRIAVPTVHVVSPDAQ